MDKHMMYKSTKPSKSRGNIAPRTPYDNPKKSKNATKFKIVQFVFVQLDLTFDQLFG